MAGAPRSAAPVQAPVEPSDRDVLDQIGRGDRSAFDILLKRHAAAVLRLARSVTGRRETAEDVLQQTFLTAYTQAATFRGEESARAWLLTIARHAAYRMGVKDSRERPADEALVDLGIQAGWGQDDPETLTLRAQREEALTAALEALDPEDRAIVVLRDLEGLSGTEAAKVLDVSEAAMKSRLHRARLRLAAALRRQGDAHD